jgi:hypothetical protein
MVWLWERLAQDPSVEFLVVARRPVAIQIALEGVVMVLQEVFDFPWLSLPK